jgi:hypothetical protein
VISPVAMQCVGAINAIVYSSLAPARAGCQIVQSQGLSLSTR